MLKWQQFLPLEQSDHPAFGGLKAADPRFGSLKKHFFLEAEGQPFINGCFNWMIPNLYIGNGWKSQFPSIYKRLFGCLSRIKVDETGTPGSSFGRFGIFSRDKDGCAPNNVSMVFIGFSRESWG